MKKALQLLAYQDLRSKVQVTELLGISFTFRIRNFNRKLFCRLALVTKFAITDCIPGTPVNVLPKSVVLLDTVWESPE